jgi:hypothetical protein
MKVNLQQTLKDFSGNEMKQGENPLMLSSLCIDALLGTYNDERITGEEKVARFGTAQKIYQAQNECDLTADEVVKLKTLTGKAYGPLIVGTLWPILEGKE